MKAINQPKELKKLISVAECGKREGELTFSFLHPQEEVDSTFLYLQRLREENPSLPSGTFVDARYQSAGRGQQGNSWYASPGANLLPSFCVSNSGLPPIGGWRVSEWVAISLAELVESHLKEARKLLPQKIISPTTIKWPNDIYVGDEKIAGILIAHHFCSDELVCSIVGLGLNINESHFPASLPNPVSLKRLCERDLDLDEVRKALVQRLEDYYPFVVCEAGAEKMHRSYQEWLYLRDSAALYRDTATEEVFWGRIKGVGQDGKLEIKPVKDKLRRYAFKEIEYVAAQ